MSRGGSCPVLLRLLDRGMRRGGGKGWQGAAAALSRTDFNSFSGKLDSGTEPPEAHGMHTC